MEEKTVLVFRRGDLKQFIESHCTSDIMLVLVNVTYSYDISCLDF